MRSVVASIDIGSKYIKILLSEVIGGKVTVLETKIMDSKGVKGGQIIDQLEVSRIIKQAVEEISKSLRVQIKKAVLVLPSANAKILTTNSKIKISNEFNMITKQDVEYVNEIARKPLENADVSIINSFPFKYATDVGNSYEGAPVGYQSSTLTCEIIAYGIPRQTYSDYVSAVNLANIEVIDTQLSA